MFYKLYLEIHKTININFIQPKFIYQWYLALKVEICIVFFYLFILVPNEMFIALIVRAWKILSKYRIHQAYNNLIS